MKTPKATTNKQLTKITPKKKREGKKAIHPELQKGLMSLMCFQRQLRNLWLAEFLTPSSSQAEQRGLDSERRGNANANNSFLPEIISNRQGEKKEPVGKPQGISIQVVYGESTRVLTKFPPPGIFIAHCKVAFSI